MSDSSERQPMESREAADLLKDELARCYGEEGTFLDDVDATEMHHAAAVLIVKKLIKTGEASEAALVQASVQVAMDVFLQRLQQSQNAESRHMHERTLWAFVTTELATMASEVKERERRDAEDNIDRYSTRRSTHRALNKYDTVDRRLNKYDIG